MATPKFGNTYPSRLAEILSEQPSPESIDSYAEQMLGHVVLLAEDIVLPSFFLLSNKNSYENRSISG